MLLQFSVENFRSFRGEAVLSLLPDPSDAQHGDHLLPSQIAGAKRALRVAAIYGANASGKSNLVDAVRFAKDLILDGTDPHKSIPVTPFKLSSRCLALPTTFEFIFNEGGARYTYGMILNSKRISEEWLTMAGSGADAKLFERKTDSKDRTVVDFGEKLFRLGGKGEPHGITRKDKPLSRRSFLRFVAEGTRPNQLFLTEAISRNVTELEDVVTWFRSRLWTISPEPNARIETLVESDKDFATSLGSFLRRAGTGIQSVEQIQRHIDLSELCSAWPDEYRQKLESEFASLGPTEELVVTSPFRERLVVSKSANGDSVVSELQLGHQGDRRAISPLNLREESDGTQRLIHIFPLLSVAKKGGRVVFFDELDLRLHPFLARLMVDEFIRTAKNSQLIFTTHDTHLMDLGLLRRDEIWLVDKSRMGDSSLTSLAEFKVRPDLRIEKAYLSKRFGGVPAIAQLNDLNETPWDDAQQEIHAVAER